MVSRSSSAPDPAQGRLYLLVAVLFVAYLCVAIPLSIVPVFVTERLAFDNVWAGLSVGLAFFSTILSRGYAGSLSDRRGAKTAVLFGLAFYVIGALVTCIAGLATRAPWPCLLAVLAGRLLVGLGESLAGVGVTTWGIAIVGPARSGKVLALVGAAIYGALAVGAPFGLILFERLGFAGAMAVSALLPGLGLLVIGPLSGAAPHAQAERPSFVSILGRIWRHGLIVCLQGVGFAAIGAFFVLDFHSRGWSHAGLGFTAFGVGFVLVRLAFSHLPDRFGGLTVAVCSLAVEGLGQLLIWNAHAPLVALAGAFCTGLGCSMIFPAMGREVLHLVPPHLRGTALGGFSAFQDLAYGLTGPLAGILADRAGYGSVFLLGGVAAWAGLGVALSLRRMQRAVASGAET